MYAKLAGLSFRPADAKAVARALKVGDLVDLAREPTNPHDRNAIQVLVNGTHIGYLAAVQAADLASLMDDGKSLVAAVTVAEPNNIIFDIGRE